jgi:hypothetical protein
MARRRNPGAGTVLALLLGLAGMGAGFWLTFGAPRWLTADDRAVGGYVPGVTVLTGAQLTARQWRFLSALRSVVPASTPITVTSGLRSYEEQARVMWAKVQAGEPLHVLYGYAVERALMPIPYSEAAWTQAIRGLYDANVLDPDGHVGGGAVDLRTQGLTTAQVQSLVDGAARLGARPLVETTPPHLHVSRLPL